MNFIIDQLVARNKIQKAKNYEQFFPMIFSNFYKTISISWLFKEIVSQKSGCEKTTLNDTQIEKKEWNKNSEHNKSHTSYSYQNMDHNKSYNLVLKLCYLWSTKVYGFI